MDCRAWDAEICREALQNILEKGVRELGESLGGYSVYFLLPTLLAVWVSCLTHMQTANKHS
jgi:hypothetical protein